MYNEQKETSEYVCKKLVVANVAYNTIEQVNEVSMQNITARAKDDHTKRLTHQDSMHTDNKPTVE